MMCDFCECDRCCDECRRKECEACGTYEQQSYAMPAYTGLHVRTRRGNAIRGFELAWRDAFGISDFGIAQEWASDY